MGGQLCLIAIPPHTVLAEDDNGLISVAALQRRLSRAASRVDGAAAGGSMRLRACTAALGVKTQAARAL
ncbi:hypothetical protein EYF80_010477 [Liparis tanakae]|uniref:Uncharacterized protein n=1 Tax=Liparis tanakae TaxID=230148 RepID=A0A4Z2IPY2_9TELE|nr:hypothetical protein EYF80_010477 [Liparis tanakae]